MTLRTVALTPDLWPDVERLFGPRGATAGCWCQWVVLQKGERFEDVKGEEAHARFERQVKGGERRGVLAYDGAEPVGWAAHGPRRGFARIDRAPSLACDDADEVWSVSCFFVKAGRRGQGVATALLRAVIEAARNEGAVVLEGYPVKSDKPQAAAFVWTGTVSLFEKFGFRQADDRTGGKVRVRLDLKAEIPGAKRNGFTRKPLRP